MKKTVAIISTNKEKFSETFIHGIIKKLPFRLVVYSLGYLPTQISLDRGKSYTLLTEESASNKLKTAALKQSFKEQGIDLVFAQYGPSGVSLLPIMSEMNIPLIVHFHGYDAFRNDVLGSYGLHYKSLFKASKAIVVVSKEMKNQLIHLGCEHSKIHLIVYGIDTNIFKHIPNQKKNDLITCSRFVEKKGIKYTLLAFQLIVQKLPELNLTIIGDGPLEVELKEQVIELGLEQNVKFIGILSQKEIAKSYESAQLYIQHSIRANDNDGEGTPLSIMEAMAAGLPIVATKHGGIVDLVEVGINGFLVEERNYSEMAERIFLLLTQKEQMEKMGKNNSAKIKKDYTNERYIKDLEQLIDSCLE